MKPRSSTNKTLPVWSMTRVLGVLAGLSCLLVRTAPAWGATFTVNSTIDVVDADPGDGRCATAGGDCTLRAAVQETNALSGADTINLPAGTYLLTLHGTYPDPADVGSLDITEDLTLLGAGRDTTVIDGGYTRGSNEPPPSGTIDVVLTISPPGPPPIPLPVVKISDVSITKGSKGGVVADAKLTLERCAISNNGSPSDIETGDTGGITVGVGFLGNPATSSSEVTLINSTVSNNMGPNGAGIKIFHSIVTLINSTVSGNTTGLVGAGFVGAGIWNVAGATTTLINSTVSDNRVFTTGAGGGGIANDGLSTAGESTMTLINSTVSGNTVEGRNDFHGGSVKGGGIFNFGFNNASLTLINSTVSDNTVNNIFGGTSFGGGIFNIGGALHLLNATITANTATSLSPDPQVPPGTGMGGGVANPASDDSPAGYPPGTVTAYNTIIAGNSALTGDNDYFGVPASGSFNLIGGNPQLDLLTNNGGPTLTHALLSGSPAIDAGDPDGCKDGQGNLLITDQRGAVRPEGPRCDIGAIEFGSSPPSGGGTLTCSTLVTNSTFDTPTETEIFEVSGVKDQLVSITVAGLTGTVNPCWRLKDPNDAQLGAGCEGQPELAVLLPADGTYTLEVYEQPQNETGMYSLMLDCQLPGQCSSVATLTCGATGSGTLSRTIERDCFQFEDTAGQQVTIGVRSTSGTLDACWHLRDPQGNYVTEQPVCEASESVQLPKSGTYTIEITDLGYNEKGSYSVTLEGGGTFYRDADSDGYGNPAVSTQACSVPAGYSANNTDCDDASASVHPGAPEVCNGVDDDCNGQTDETFTDLGTACSVGIGTCLRTGTKICALSGTATECNAIPGTPGPEVCNGVDDNCDGVVDNNPTDVGQNCNTGQPGVCSAGMTGCSTGAISCQRTVSPSSEVCDGLDNNCNGTIDDGFNVGAACTVGVGACQRTGSLVCTANEQGTQCNVNPGTPSPEICGDGVDQDCNGADLACPTSLTVLTPNGRETWAIGSTQTIQWNPAGVKGKVKIELSRDGGGTWEVLFVSTTNDGTQNWKVTAPATSQALVRISSVSTPVLTDTSNGPFTLAEGTVTVVSPDGGESWPIGSKQTIRWTGSGFSGQVRIELSRDGGNSWTALFSGTANDGAQNWKVTGPATNQARIRVSSVKDSGATDVSNSSFSIP